MINFYFIAVKESIKKIGLVWFSLYVVLSSLIKVKKKFVKILLIFLPSYSNNYRNIKYKYNKLFDYEKVKNFHVYDRKQLVNNKIKIFSNVNKDYSRSFLQKKNELKKTNDSNKKTAFRIFDKINKKKLTNWRIDKISGYEWGSYIFSDSIQIQIDKKIDIKVPWELARLQHLTNLSINSYVNKLDDFSFIKNQILDFISSNPPYWGVNWFNAMEVSIRGSNLCIIADILKQKKNIKDEEFLIILNSINDHFNYVIENLEWTTFSTNNHYLSNLVGLLVMGYYLPRSKFNEIILKFTINQFYNEIDCQFFKDGGSKEGSTGYHLLCSEMIFFGMFFLEKLKKEKFFSIKLFKQHMCKKIINKINFISLVSPHLNVSRIKKINKKIENIFEFSKNLVRNNDTLLQIGDNDSGCFIDLNFNNSLMEKKSFHLHSTKKMKGSFFEVIKSSINFPLKTKRKVKIKKFVSNTNFNEKEYKYNKSYFFKFPNKINTKEIENHKFADFGLYIFEHKMFKLFVVCKKKYDFLKSGHYHYDNLSIDLSIDRKNVITDPGSFTYTSDFKARKKFKGFQSHFVPRFKKFKLNQDKDLVFNSNFFFKADCLNMSKNNFLGKIIYDNGVIFRHISISENGIKISDCSNYEDIFDLRKIFKNNRISSSYRILDNDKIFNLDFL